MNILRRLTGKWRNLRAEWRARRAGHKYSEDDISTSARHIIGPTGWMWSNAWDKMAEGSDAYNQSFDRRLPPSIFVSERDRKRMNRPIPLPERRIEHHGEEDDDLTDEEIAWGSQPPD